ncbi:MAG: hypothetical protein ACD_3C00191G0009 [uncultured bacterium (gcode 4)]|uniref:Type II secretion system protein GspG C-terminal domain-containing protein n=1 Tax=uncultured bacterium (gcode 4) TaxID=1234023 RepID=K2FXA5_9BACT|nr:MAG: hypothetical protein ACD_3C00191G0009 [uncultured bacterium (gcode 4)]
MPTKNQYNTNAFTLVELIVVIVILAILATIAFLSFSSQSGSARDSTRLSDISSIKKWMEMYNVNSGLYPSPDNPTSFTYSWGTIWNQWALWDSAYRLIQKTLSKKVKDPLKDSEYDYSLAANKREYQVAWNFENPTSFEKTYNPFESDFLISQFSILNSPNANALGWTWVNVYISGNYNWVMLKVFTWSIYYFVPTPTLFGKTDSTVYNNAFWSWKDILPWVNNYAQFDSSKIYSTWWTNLSATDITNLMTTIKSVYLTWNITTPLVQAIVNASWSLLTDLWAGLIKNSLWGSTSNSNWVSEWVWGVTAVWTNVSSVPWQDALYAWTYLWKVLWVAWTENLSWYWKTSDTLTSANINETDWKVNVLTIKSVDPTLTYHPATKYCEDLSWAWHTDWYLPAMAYWVWTTTNCGAQAWEIQFLYCQHKWTWSQALLGFTWSYYWSSSEYVTEFSIGARGFRFDTGGHNGFTKNSNRKSKCVRTAN